MGVFVCVMLVCVLCLFVLCALFVLCVCVLCVLVVCALCAFDRACLGLSVRLLTPGLRHATSAVATRLSEEASPKS